MAATCKRSRRDLTLKDKYEIIVYIENNPEEKRKDVAKRFSIPESTLSRLASGSTMTDVKQAYEGNKMASKTKRMRKPSFEDVDTSLLTRIRQMQTTKPDSPITGDVLLAKANEFNTMSSNADKLISHSWINRWKNRHQISLKNLGLHEAEPGKCKYKMNSHTTSCGDNVETSGLLSDQDIVGLYLVPDDFHLVPNDHEEIEESSTVSTNDAFGAIELLQRSIDNTELTPILSLLQQIEHILENNCT